LARCHVAVRTATAREQELAGPYRCGDLLDPDGDDITATKLAVDCQIEHGEVAGASFDLELRPNRPAIANPQPRGLIGKK
jgi:hypothetical protein